MLNSGKIIKVIAIIWGFILFISILLGGSYIWNQTPNNDDAGIFILILSGGGLVISFITSLLLYGFGSLIDSNNQILHLLKKDNKK